MTRLVWGAAGERYYEYGVDRGVLYAGGGSGVPWNGLVAVNETQEGGEVTSYYFDGVKYLDVVANEDFKATIQALSAPPEFDACQGKKALAVGLFATGQPRTTFGMCYRTMIGNDTVGSTLGYKLHIVYNCTAASADRGNKSIGSGAIDPNEYSWSVSTVPPVIGTTYKPTAHFIIDSTKTPAVKLAALEDLLYGTASTTSQLPSQATVIATLT